MPKISAKTNAMRIVNSLQIAYDVAYYEVNDEHLDASQVAEVLGVDREIVFKTLVAQSESGSVFVFCIPAPAQLDLKKAASAVGAKKVQLIPLSDLLRLTGYIRGGCSPIGMKKDYPTYIEESAVLHNRIYINGGAKGVQLYLDPQDLVKACKGMFADLV